MKVKRGDIVYLKYPIPAREHIQGGDRPFVVISNDKGNYYSEICIIVPLTGSKKKLLPTHTVISHNHSICLCEQIFTISQNDVNKIVGHLTEYDTWKLKKCLAASILS